MAKMEEGTTSKRQRDAVNHEGGSGRGGGKQHKMPVRDVDEEAGFTRREMKLTATVAILIIMLFGLIAFIAVSGPLAGLLKPSCFDEKLGFPGVCDSVECIDISHRSIHSANFSADPCNDFYNFACAKWKTQNPISEDQLYVAANVNQLRDNVDKFLKDLLEQETPKEKTDPAVTALKNFYTSCINFTNPNEDELILDLMDSLGGYKTIDVWSDKDFDLTEVILRFLKVNAAPLIDITLDIDAKDRKRYALIVELPRQTSLVPNLFRLPHQDDDLLQNDYAYYNQVKKDVLLSYIETTPGILHNATLQSSSTRSRSSLNNRGNGSNSDSNNDSNATNTEEFVNRQALYKMIKDSIDARKRENLKALVRKAGQLIKMNEAEILSDGQEISYIAANIEKIKPSQRSRKFWKQQNKVYNFYTLEDLQQQFNVLNWKYLFEGLINFDITSMGATHGNRKRSSPSGHEFAANGRNNKRRKFPWHNSAIYVPYPDYLRRILQMTQYTSKRMLYNTMLMLYVKDMLHDLLPRNQIRRREHQTRHQQNQQPRTKNIFRQQQSERQQNGYQQPRWKFCVQSTKSVFAMELSSLYMKSFSPSHLKRITHDVENIFSNVKATLISFLNRTSESSPLGQNNPNEPKKYEGNNGESKVNTNISTVDANDSKGVDSNSRFTLSENHDYGSSDNITMNESIGGGNGSNDSKLNIKDEAIKKIMTLKGNFVGPSFYLDDDFLDDAIKNIRMDPTNFLFNVKVAYRTFREQLYHLYLKPVNEEKATWAFVAFPTTVNAFYIQQFNSVVIPLAFLNPPHYVERAPVYINYATIALTLAHEALHALDSSGSGFDADGRLQDWWQTEPKAFLQEQTNCVAKQYSHIFQHVVLPFHPFHHFPIQVDGTLTQNENLADIAGLKVAFSAYRNYRLETSKADLKSERRIPGLVLTLEQAYFLSVAQAYCANISPMGYIFLLEMDEHTPHPERINGMLMNNLDFIDAYSCKAGTPMNPPTKCTMW